MGGEAEMNQMTQLAAGSVESPGDKEPRKESREYLHLEMGGKDKLEGGQMGRKARKGQLII